MKEWWLFGGVNDCGIGGMCDFIMDFDTFGDAKEYIKDRDFSNSWTQIINTKTGNLYSKGKVKNKN